MMCVCVKCVGWVDEGFGILKLKILWVVRIKGLGNFMKSISIR